MKKLFIISLLLTLLFTFGCEDKTVFESQFNQEDMTLTIEPPGGTYHTDQTVFITNKVPESIIRYSTDGSNPTDTSYVYADSLIIAASTQLKARAYKAGWLPSETISADYLMEVAPLLITSEGGSYHNDQEVTITCETPNAIIYYTKDGSNPTDTSLVYTEPLLIDFDTTLKVQAFREGWTSSEMLTHSYHFRVADPVIIPEGGSYDEPQEVRITCTTDGAIIRYTTNGEEPTGSSPQYTVPLNIDGNTTLNVQAFREGWTASGTLTHTYHFRVADPVIIPEGGSYDEPQEVRITCETEGAIIRYTTTGEEPTGTSSQYATPLSIDGNATLKVQAFREGWSASEIVREDYEFQVANPVFSPPGGFYQAEQSVTITCTTEGTIIRYTMNGNDPTVSSPQYTVPVVVPANATLKARAFRERWTKSEVTTARYYYPIAGMVFVEGGIFNPATDYTVTLSSFFIGMYEVTQSEYMAVMGTNPSYFSGNPNRPVERVSWFDAIEYCNRRSMWEGLTPVYSYGSSGTNPDNWPPGWNTSDGNHTNVSTNWNANGYRLPTEMEWEFAARGGVTAQNAGTFNYRYSGTNVEGTGEGQLGDYAWYWNNSGSRTYDVGTKLSNELGLYDMSGNVWEWCWDIYGSYPTGSHNDPKGANSGTPRVSRGGSWDNDAAGCTVSFRNHANATYRPHRGYRVSRSILLN